MLILFFGTFLLAICTAIIKKKIWFSLNGFDNLSLEQSFFCWFTFSDFGKSNQASTRFVFILSNITNLVITICLLIMLVCAALIGLSIGN